MTNRTTQDVRHDAWRSRVNHAYINKLAAERRRETSQRHTMMAIAILIVMSAVAYVFRT